MNQREAPRYGFRINESDGDAHANFKNDPAFSYSENHLLDVATLINELLDELLSKGLQWKY